LAAQDFKCAIGKEVFPAKQHAIINYDPKTGKVRGLLCTRCNAVVRGTEQFPAELAAFFQNPPAYALNLPDIQETPSATADEIVSYLETKLERKLSRDTHSSTGRDFDICDPITKTAVDFCELLMHHEDVPGMESKHVHVTRYHEAKNDGYRLITLFDYEYQENPHGVLSRLVSLMQQNKTPVGGRQCTVKEVPLDQTRMFLNTYHIQGAPYDVKYSLGLFHKENLVGLVTGSPHHRQGQEGMFVLSRLCFKSDVHVTGGSERLFKPFVDYAKSQRYKKVITWSDSRWTEGAVYGRLGMTLTEESKPDYSYVVLATGEHKSKQSQRKKATKCPEGKTEFVWARERGLSRIWDCGKKHWELVL